MNKGGSEVLAMHQPMLAVVPSSTKETRNEPLGRIWFHIVSKVDWMSSSLSFERIFGSGWDGWTWTTFPTLFLPVTKSSDGT